MKELYNTNEQVRSTQVKELKDSLDLVNQGLTDVRQGVLTSITSFKACIDRLESVQASCAAANKSGIKLVSQDLKNCEFTLSVLNENLKKTLATSAKNQKQKQKSKVSNDIGCQCDFSVINVCADGMSGHTGSTSGDVVDLTVTPTGPDLDPGVTLTSPPTPYIDTSQSQILHETIAGDSSPESEKS